MDAERAEKSESGFFERAERRKGLGRTPQQKKQDQGQGGERCHTARTLLEVCQTGEVVRRIAAAQLAWRGRLFKAPTRPNEWCSSRLCEEQRSLDLRA